MTRMGRAWHDAAEPPDRDDDPPDPIPCRHCGAALPDAPAEQGWDDAHQVYWEDRTCPTCGALSRHME